jgi:hypothetical protein
MIQPRRSPDLNLAVAQKGSIHRSIPAHENTVLAEQCAVNDAVFAHNSSVTYQEKNPFRRVPAHTHP